MPVRGGSPIPGKERSIRRCLDSKVVFDLGERLAATAGARDALRRLLSPLPPASLDELSEAAAGYFVVWSGETCYRPGLSQHGEAVLAGVALLNLDQLLAQALPVLRTLAALVDHLLGSPDGRLPAPISREALASAAWAEFHRRLLAAYSLGYADDEAARGSPTEYFAWAFAAYCRDRRQLAATDPLAYRLLHSTVFSQAYWRGHLLRPAGSRS